MVKNKIAAGLLVLSMLAGTCPVYASETTAETMTETVVETVLETEQTMSETETVFEVPSVSQPETEVVVETEAAAEVMAAETEGEVDINVVTEAQPGDQEGYMGISGAGEDDDYGISTFSIQSEAKGYKHNAQFAGADIRLGIDVSEHNGKIDWKKVKADGVEFAIIRVAGRWSGSKGGTKEAFYTDDNYAYNLKNAAANGIKVGAYFFSQAITKSEAEAEAKKLLELVKGYKIDMPLVIDFEYISGGRLQTANLSKNTATTNTLAFCKVIENAGYDSMVYTGKNILVENRLDAAKIVANTKLWMAHYPSSKQTSYTGWFDFWQFTSQGKINGITKQSSDSDYVDLDFWYNYGETPDNPGSIEPALKSVTATAGGCVVTWDKASGAKGYQILRSTDGGDWDVIGTTERYEFSYTDTTAEAGHTYRYTLQCFYTLTNPVLSGYDKTGKTVTVDPEVPTLKTVAYAADQQISVTWTSDVKARGYAIYKKIDDGEWARIDKTDKLYYNDTVAPDGKNYTYSVAMIYTDAQGKEQQTAYNADGMSQLALVAMGTTSGAKAIAYNRIDVTWKAISGVDGYRVYRKTGSGSWTSIGETTSLSYADKTADIGTTYTYSVCGYKMVSGVKVYGSYASKGVSAKTSLSKPTSVKASASYNNAIKISWNKVSGANGYKIYKWNGKAWQYLATLTTNSYRDTSVKTGTTYKYTVKAYRKNQAGDQVSSGYDTKGVSFKYYLNMPKTTAVVSTGYKSIKVSWTKVSGAQKYYIYRKEGSTWKKVGTAKSSASSYTDKTCTTGKKYAYHVCAVKKVSGVERVSSYSQEKAATALIKAVKLSSTKSVSTGVKVSWKKTDGANGYYIYRKTSGGSWKKVGTVSKSGTVSYTDTTASKWKTYYYTVKGYRNVNSKPVIGLYNTTGLKAIRY